MGILLVALGFLFGGIWPYVPPAPTSGGGGGGPALVSHAAKANTSSPSTNVSLSLSTTGADFLVCQGNAYEATPPTGISGSLSGSFTRLTPAISGNAWGAIFYVADPTTGSDTITIAGGQFMSLACASFSGVATSSPFDQQSAGISSSTTVQPGSITPSVSGALILSGICPWAYSQAGTINSSFTTTDYLNATLGGNAVDVGLAYFVQGSASAINPTWTISGSANSVATIASFKP